MNEEKQKEIDHVYQENLGWEIRQKGINTGTAVGGLVMTGVTLAFPPAAIVTLPMALSLSVGSYATHKAINAKININNGKPPLEFGTDDFIAIGGISLSLLPANELIDLLLEIKHVHHNVKLKDNIRFLVNESL